mmetsp:Transcript_10317/g.15584  ORF Transcript_10317/g.15584 Transcript_10317/m.15584 type:complete len:116 (-) Transcript_10317:36-383(-)
MVHELYNDKNDLNLRNCALQLRKIIHWLYVSPIDDWMFIWKKSKGENEVDELILRDLKQILPAADIMVTCHDYRRTHDSDSQRAFVIQNEHCKINGWRETWMMQQEIALCDWDRD